MMKRDDSWIQCRTAARTYKSRLHSGQQLPPRKKQEVVAVGEALGEIYTACGPAAANFLKLYHIDQTHTLHGAATASGYSVSRAKDLIKTLCAGSQKSLGTCDKRDALQRPFYFCKRSAFFNDKSCYHANMEVAL